MAIKYLNDLNPAAFLRRSATFIKIVFSDSFFAVVKGTFTGQKLLQPNSAHY